MLIYQFFNIFLPRGSFVDFFNFIVKSVDILNTLFVLAIFGDCIFLILFIIIIQKNVFYNLDRFLNIFNSRFSKNVPVSKGYQSCIIKPHMMTTLHIQHFRTFLQSLHKFIYHIYVYKNLRLCHNKFSAVLFSFSFSQNIYFSY